jgi:hypothetical protein
MTTRTIDGQTVLVDWTDDDEQASREGRARKAVRDSHPAIMGRKIQSGGCRRNDRKTKCATNHVRIEEARRKLGWDG